MRSTEKKRQETIERILAYRKRFGMRPGIFAAEVCQVCGQVKPFDGFIPALSLHIAPDQAFVCGHCRRANLATTLRKRDERRCEICCRIFPRDNLTRDAHRWVCQPCTDRVQAEHPGMAVMEYVSDLVAYRYIDLTCPDEEALAAFEARVRETAKDLDRLAHSN